MCYRGTLDYVSPEMKKLYQSRDKGWVDLHFNDLWGLRITLSKMGVHDYQFTEKEVIVRSKHNQKKPPAQPGLE